MDRFDNDECYMLTGDQMNKLYELMIRLFNATDKPFKVDETRDWANVMDAILDSVPIIP